MPRHKIVTVVGTRPEGIKMAPVIRALNQRREIFHHTLVSTAQHRQMLDSVFAAFHLKPDVDLELMEADQHLAHFASRALTRLSDLFIELAPDMILVQGDTTTVLTAGLAAFYNGIKVGHIEAGLRSFNRSNPFPEEINRQLTGCLADLHFAPTEQAQQNLLREGVPPASIFVTGNTIVDALESMPLKGPFENSFLNSIASDSTRRLILVTAHRRENHGEPLVAISKALKHLVSAFTDIDIIFPVHLNPNVRAPIHQHLGSVSRVHLLEPLSYTDLLRLMKRCYLILTDSGGIQEEAASFHKPVLILRAVTERPELIEAGAGKLVGTETTPIVEETTRLLTDCSAYESMCAAKNPFGDGHAAERIVDILTNHLVGSAPVAPSSELLSQALFSL